MSDTGKHVVGEMRMECVHESVQRADRGLINFAAYCFLMSLAFLDPLVSLGRLALDEELYSHILLIPVTAAYLAVLRKDLLPVEHMGSKAGALLVALCAAAILFPPHQWSVAGWSLNDRLARSISGYVLLIAAGGFMFLGTQWMRVLSFPFCLLAFMVPLPGALLSHVENVLMRASAGMAQWFFIWTGTPVFRAGQMMQLPGVTLEVARECSGIRSTWVLLITSLIASHLFLSSFRHRALLVAMVLPLGIVRNALRVLVIGLLCVHRGPHMIDSWIHRHGGPVFFAVTLLPLLLCAAWFRSREMNFVKSNAPPIAPARRRFRHGKPDGNGDDHENDIRKED